MNTSLSKRENFQQGVGQLFSGTTFAFNKKAGAIAGIYLDLSDAAAITWHVSYNNTDWFAITPPLGTSLFAAPGTSAIAIPADYLAFLAPYSYARMTFGASQTNATIVVELMA